TSVGLGKAEHAFLGAVVEQPHSGGVVLTGRLAMNTQPWLADHAVDGVVLFPAAGFVELAIRAGDEVECPSGEELLLYAPLLIPADGAVSTHVVVGADRGSRQRSISVYSRASQPDSQWILHAEGTLGMRAVEPAADMSVWPPVGAVAVDITEAY